MQISIGSSGSFDKTEAWLKSMSKNKLTATLSRFAEEGVAALAAATPVDSGVTANSWGYKIERKGKSFTITWTNSNAVGGVPLVILLQHGHGTGTGGYVQGRDFINPAMRPIFDRISDEVRKAVTNS